MVAVTIGEYIKRDHDDFRLMFERLQGSSPAEVPLRQQVYPFLVNRILSHHVAEEATIFPLMERNPELVDIALVLIEEHRGMAMLARDLGETPWEDRLWRARIFPFYDVISAHWGREETEVFPHAGYYFTRKEQEGIGDRFMGVLRREWRLKEVTGGVPPVMFRRSRPGLPGGPDRQG